MTLRPIVVVLSLLALSCLVGCAHLPGKPAPGPEVPRPDSVLEPVVLFNQNCSGCHGADGKNGPAMMALTRTLGPYSRANARVRALRPAFAAE